MFSPGACLNRADPGPGEPPETPHRSADGSGVRRRLTGLGGGGGVSVQVGADLGQGVEDDGLPLEGDQHVDRAE